MPTRSIPELAAALATTPDRLRQVVRDTLRRIPRRRYYVFRITGGQAAQRPPDAPPRLIAAFPSPDDALTFAQRNGYGSNAQLRPLDTAELLLLLLSDAGLGMLLFVRESGGEPQQGFGPALRITRDELIEHLRADPAPAATNRLAAEHYDDMRFGVDFKDRAAFRVALAEAIEQVVATYEPPPGSIDRGPRSIFAASAVEAWLRSNGFPHAHQRRWIDVSDAPEYGGALELCEIDGGTRNRLTIQLLIDNDPHGRQYIRQINVTS
jgi:hypothetical protein